MRYPTWEQKHRARVVLDAYQSAYADARARGLDWRAAGRAANEMAERACRRYHTGRDDA